MADPMFDCVSFVEHRLKEATSKGEVTLQDYVDMTDEIAAGAGVDPDRLREEVGKSIGAGFAITLAEPRAPGR